MDTDWMATHLTVRCWNHVPWPIAERRTRGQVQLQLQNPAVAQVSEQILWQLTALMEEEYEQGK